MKYFIFSFIGVIIILTIFLYVKRKKMTHKKYDEKIMKDLKYLRKELETETNPNKRLEIIRKIEIISSFYN